MKTTEELASEMFQHSFLIVWNNEKQKWLVECPLLKIRFDADTYKEALTELCRAILKSNISEDFHKDIEKHKADYMNSDS
ncbi:hypothetical protein [Acinetobacter pittii]|uniref:hypothetical protein n=1 Tax=Acinetobacter pittii TaxID=48296 RepID=UPI000A34ED22|nr:hypothetical protein [Acinetobacter pittii]OTL19449.1 hypothetical protein B9X78_16815 [Acinetobacter pittii]